MMLLTCLGATDYGDANAEATNEKEALDFNEFSKVLIFFSLSQHCYDYRHLSVNHFLLYADLLFDNIFCFILVFFFVEV